MTREERIAQLIEWAMKECKNWLTEYVKRRNTHGVVQQVHYAFYWPTVADEARKRWAVTRHTANDYVDIVGRRLELEYQKTLRTCIEKRSKNR